MSECLAAHLCVATVLDEGLRLRRLIVGGGNMQWRPTCLLLRKKKKSDFFYRMSLPNKEIVHTFFGVRDGDIRAVLEEEFDGVPIGLPAGDQEMEETHSLLVTRV